MNIKKHTYKFITISGDPGSGKSTFARKVAQETGFELITTGNIFRELAAQKGITLNDLNQLAETKKEIDHQVDNYVAELNNKDGNYVLDSRMAWHFLKDAFKVRLSVNSEVAAKRIYGDNAALREKFSTLEEAQAQVKARKQSEAKRYRDLYNVNIGDDNNFNLVIDTSDKTPEEALEAFFSAYNIE